MPPPTEPTPPSPHVETALQQKRATLDREVEVFRTEKDREYRQFEVQIRSREAAAAPPAPTNGHADRADPANPRPDRAASNLDERALRDVFAAPYISLLDHPRKPPPSPPPSAHTTFANAPPHPSSPDGSAPPSPDASLLPSSDPPPTHALPHAPASPHDATPNTTPHHHQRRASSSPIPARALRSSLRGRRPAAPPAPNKHVLFAIDDALLSPRSSPLARRRRPLEGFRAPGAAGTVEGDAGESAVGADERGGRGGSARAVVVPKEDAEAAKAADEEGAEGGEEEEKAIFVPRVSPARVPAPTPLLASPPRRSYRELVEPTGRHAERASRDARAAADEEDDEFARSLGDGDPLFALEEGDAGGGAAGWEEEEEEGGREGGEDEGRGEEGVQVEMEESPRAGSLPIEIRWPGRRS